MGFVHLTMQYYHLPMIEAFSLCIIRPNPVLSVIPFLIVVIPRLPPLAYKTICILFCTVSITMKHPRTTKQDIDILLR